MRKPLAKKMNELTIKLMLRESRNRISDASILAQSTKTRSDSAYLLNLLSLEILLKCLLLITTEKLEHGHNYFELFNKLPEEKKENILSSAKNKQGPIANFTDINSKLKIFESNFIKLRYPYEKYTKLTEGEYVARGEEWIKRGAITEEADFQYYPNELYGLQQALIQDIEEWLTNNSINRTENTSVQN
jgi:hypothetical protein